MVSDTLEQRIYELVRSHDGIYLFKKKELTPSTDFWIQIYGWKMMKHWH